MDSVRYEVTSQKKIAPVKPYGKMRYGKPTILNGIELPEYVQKKQNKTRMIPTHALNVFF